MAPVQWRLAEMNDTIRIQTRCGAVKGLNLEDAVLFRGIPFAEAERFSLPTLIEKWEGEIDATGTELECPQLSTYTDDSERFFTREFRPNVQWNYAESPLTLNIAAPKGGKNCPVLVFIHGGGFFTGKQSELPAGTSTEFAKRGIVLVSLGYRLNVFGQFRSGNYCHYDQIAGIKWVRDNIAAFGGDPDRITLSGQSAGAISVMNLLYSEELKGMIQGAFMMSGGGFFPNFGYPWTEKESRPFWDAVREKAGCTTDEELKTAPAETVWRAWWEEKQNHGSIHLLLGAVDGHIVPGRPAKIRKSGKMLNVPVLIGVTSQDMIAPLAMHRILISFGLWSAKNRRQPVYGYLFDRVPPGNCYRAFHSSDLWYVFGNMDKSWRPFEQRDYEIQKEMTDAVAAFVKMQNPGWEPISPSMRKVRCFGDRKKQMISGLQAFPELLINTLFRRGPM